MTLNADMPPLPEEFKESLLDLHDIDHVRLIESLEGPSSVSVRFNPRKPLDTYPFASDGKVAWWDKGVYLSSKPNFAYLPEWHAGTFYVQDASSMIFGAIVKQLSRDLGLRSLRVLDLCAAPGGKSLAAIDALPEDSLVLSNEVVNARANILHENLVKWGYCGSVRTSTPVDLFPLLGEAFDITIADVPCSGEGMMRKEPQARLQWSQKLINNCVNVQREILKSAVKTVVPGGYLIYSTCTFNRHENEENIKWLTDNYPFEAVDMLFDYEGVSPSNDSEFPAMRFFPHLVRGEGLFVCVLRKTGSLGGKMRFSKKTSNMKIKNEIKKEIFSWLEKPDYCDAYEINNDIYLYPVNHREFVGVLNSIIRNSYSGIPFVSIKGKSIIPGPAQTVIPYVKNGVFPTYELPEKESLRYLARENIILPENIQKGYVCMTYKNIPLGFVKNLGMRTNNLYPSEWRLRQGIK